MSAQRLRRQVRREWVLAAATVILAPFALRAQEASLTIYADGRVLVRRTLPLEVPRGTSILSVELGVPDLDPATLISLTEGAEIRGVRLQAATGQAGALRRALGRDLEFAVNLGDSTRLVRATLLSVEPQAVRLDGRVIYAFPGTPSFPDSLVQLAPRVELTVEATRPQRGLRVAYLTGGLSWGASYAFTVPRSGAGRAAVLGTATIENSGNLSVRDAEVQLLAGEVRRVERRPIWQPMEMPLTRAAPSVPGPQRVGETHVYTLPARVDIAPGVAQSVPLFAGAEAPVEPEFILRPSSYGPVTRWPEPERDRQVEVSYLVRRTPGTGFGSTPLPAGVARVFAPDSVGRLQLLGETPIDHTPAGQELHLTTGTAFDITGERTQLTYEVRGRREVVASYRVQLRNAKDDTVTVQVLDQFPGQWEVLSSTVPPERLSAASVRFPVRVPAGGEAILEYRVRVRW